MTLSTSNYSGNPQQPFAAAEAYVPDQLIAGALQLVTQDVTVASGAATFSRGTLLGVITASGKVTISKSSANDGSQKAVGVLVDYADPTAGDVSAGMYTIGEFNGNVISALLDPSWASLAAAVALLPPTVVIKTNIVSAADPS